MLLLYEIIYVIIIISLNFCLLWPYLRKFNYAHSPPIHNMCSFMSIYMFCIKYEALSYFPRNLCFYTPPSPGLTDTMLGGLGYVGGWGRAPVARQARGPSAAARQGVVQILGGGGGGIVIYISGERGKYRF